MSKFTFLLTIDGVPSSAIYCDVKTIHAEQPIRVKTVCVSVDFPEDDEVYTLASAVFYMHEGIIWAQITTYAGIVTCDLSGKNNGWKFDFAPSTLHNGWQLMKLFY